MATLLFNAFSSLQEKLKAKNRPYANVSIEVAEGTTVGDLVRGVGLELDDVEAVFINGHVESIGAFLHHGDRVAVVPPGTPGPYRVLLGMVQGRKKRVSTSEPHIQIKLFASLRKFLPPDPDHFPISPGETVQDVLNAAGVPVDEAKLIFINGVKGETTSVLHGGERVGIFPPVGGG